MTMATTLGIGLALSLLINLAFFVIAWWQRKDHFTDITYALTFVILGAVYYGLNGAPGGWAGVPLFLVMVWAVRLGGYLLLRIHWMGRDARFDSMRERPWRWAVFWILQAATAWVVMLPLGFFYSQKLPALTWWLGGLGILIWLVGIVIETLADIQKFVFKGRQSEARWPEIGMWRHARHPNFFGEMLVWWGLWLVTLSTAPIPMLLGVVGPLFITLMLRFVSGVPLLERTAQSKWGQLAEYQRYRSQTRLLLPWPKKHPK